jgi:hypothetical protein
MNLKKIIVVFFFISSIATIQAMGLFRFIHLHSKKNILFGVSLGTGLGVGCVGNLYIEKKATKALEELKKDAAALYALSDRSDKDYASSYVSKSCKEIIPDVDLKKIVIIESYKDEPQADIINGIYYLVFPHSYMKVISGVLQKRYNKITDIKSATYKDLVDQTAIDINKKFYSKSKSAIPAYLVHELNHLRYDDSTHSKIVLSSGYGAGYGISLGLILRNCMLWRLPIYRALPLCLVIPFSVGASVVSLLQPIDRKNRELRADSHNQTLLLAQSLYNFFATSNYREQENEKYFSTHPSDEKRAQELKKVIENLRKEGK